LGNAGDIGSEYAHECKSPQDIEDLDAVRFHRGLLTGGDSHYLAPLV
jgi:hypothetical protein